MSIQRFPPEFKEEAVRQIVERGLLGCRGIGPLRRVSPQPLQVGQGYQARQDRAACDRADCRQK